MSDRPDIRQANILVVDDTPANLQLLRQTLREQNYKVRPVADGPLALQAAQTEPPDLILLDIMMPEMDGLEVCRRLKANPVTARIPIIFLTALDQGEDKVRGFEAGGVDYLTKPLYIPEVLARVKTHLTLCNLQKTLEQRNNDLETKNSELEAALAKVKMLSGMLPICANCKKIRDDKGYWQSVEVYICDHSEADFSHGICPDCMQTLYPDFST